MENKLEQLTNKLYEEGLEKGRKDAEQLLAETREKADGIIAGAEEKARQIIREAEDTARELRQNTLTETTLAGRKLIALLKENIRNLILTRIVTEPVREISQDPGFIRSFLLAFVKNQQIREDGNIPFSVILPSGMEECFDASFRKSVSEALGKDAMLEFSEGVKSGFRIQPADGSYYISFSDEDFDNLLREFLRDKVSRLLFTEE